jgi:hypothetical protein
MKSISDGFGSCEWRISIEEAIDAFEVAKMRFFIRSPINNATSEEILRRFPPETVLVSLPTQLPCSGSSRDESGGMSAETCSEEVALPLGLLSCNDSFISVSTCVDAMRTSYLAPAIQFNYYLDWLLFDHECESGLHPVDYFENRPSNIARRAHFEAFAHSVLIALKSALDRLVSVMGYYVHGISGHMTWGRIKDGKAKNFMSIVDRGRGQDDLLAFLYNEYVDWIEAAVVPRDSIIHYADLITNWMFSSSSIGDEGGATLNAVHADARDEGGSSVDLKVLHCYVTSFYALADHLLLTLATRLPLSVRGNKVSLGSLIAAGLGVRKGKRVGELIRAVQLAIEAGEIEGGLAPEVYIDFLGANAKRFELPQSWPRCTE